MDLPIRKSTRLKNFDYSSRRYYHIIVCTHNRSCIFGMNENLTEYGIIAKNELLNIPEHFDCVCIEKYMIMPDHIHIVLSVGCHSAEARLINLSTIIGLYKSGVSKIIHQYQPNLKVWQKSFYDEIIRNEKALYEICNYIEYNPTIWIEKYGDIKI